MKEVSIPFFDIRAELSKYFAKALLDTNFWKLQKLPLMSHNPSYINCAYHVKDSLAELNLANGMIGRQDFHRLDGFKQLKELTVDNNVLEDVLDCSNLSRYLPHLKKIMYKDFKGIVIWIRMVLSKIATATTTTSLITTIYSGCHYPRIILQQMTSCYILWRTTLNWIT